MILRLWRGWTTAANADAYEELIRSTIFPGSLEVRPLLSCWPRDARRSRLSSRSALFGIPDGTHSPAKIELATFPDDDPSLVIDVPLDLIEPQARVPSVQLVGEDEGYLAVRERHTERLSAVVYVGPRICGGPPAWII
jgi:hypothetical protein